jgi:glycosyltransferase involved in cell wall biosynthesis
MPSIQKDLTVCHLISGDLWAGAEVMAYHLLCSLATQPGVKVIAIVFNNGRLADELRRAGIEVIIFEESRNSFFALLLKVYRILSKKNINIIHAHRQKENMLALLIAQVLRKSRIVTTMHGMPELFGTGFSRSTLLAKLDFFILGRYFGRVVVVSEEMRNILLNRRQFSPVRTISIHNAAPQPSVQDTLKETHDRPFTIGSAGRFVPVKDFPLFIAIAELLKNESNIQFLLAGDGPLASELRQKVEEQQLNNVMFMGHVENMATFYEQIDLFMNTSLHEGIPMTILEAMGRGIPVIAPRVGGIPEIIDNGVEGFTIPTREAKDFAEMCLNLSQDPGEYNTMSFAAKKKIEEQFSITSMVQNYMRTYSELFQK